MQDPADTTRRCLLQRATHTIALGTLGLASMKASASSRSISPPAFGPLRRVDAGDLRVGYVELGALDAKPVILLHGWPYDIHSFAEVGPALAAKGFRVIVPYLRGFGPTRFVSSDVARNGQQAVLAVDVIALMDALRISNAIIGGFDWGARTANIVAALWPERCRAMVSVSGYLITSRAANRKSLAPEAELAWWYLFYFATERGRDGYSAHRREFARLIWRSASPKWNFDAATFDRSAVALDNPDHVDVVIHNYRWRIGLAAGEARYDGLEDRLAALPVIATPTITLEGDANAAPHPTRDSYAHRFVGPVSHRLVTGGIGHNLPQEAPKAFVDAIVDADGYR